MVVDQIVSTLPVVEGKEEGNPSLGYHSSRSKCEVVCVLGRLRNTSKGENHQLLIKLRPLVSKDLAGWMAGYLLPF
ncbi:hypothetical protein E2C01_010128 [Portunus trituberculatus]|uniref:Uncharacterized protein n=1 Tax=Portunus trituberculatus TaxID=210409 RepID=A0A5B7D7M3_PORTR|nr:hypothetical protein [Portunus trituberculatus]